MNAKRAKAVRQALRAHGIHAGEAEHMTGKPRIEFLPGAASVYHFTGQVRVDPESGRAVYKAAKKLGLNPIIQPAARTA